MEKKKGMEVGETSLNTYAGLFLPCDFIILTSPSLQPSSRVPNVCRIM